MIKPTLEEERVLDLCEKIEKFMNDNIGLREWGFWLPFVFVAHRPKDYWGCTFWYERAFDSNGHPIPYREEETEKQCKN